MEESWIIVSVRNSLHEYSTVELRAWREHVVRNPYCQKWVSEKVIEVLDNEIKHRLASES